MKKINLFLTAILFTFVVKAQNVADFQNLYLAPDTFWDGSDLSGGFYSGSGFFPNSYDTTYNAWSGFVYSDMKDSTTAGFGNQYSAITASGHNNSSNYAVADEYGQTYIKLTGSAAGGPVNGFYITNGTYDYLSMKSGDAFAKKFGGVSGNDPDWFRLTVKGWLNGVQSTDTVDFYLADYRFANNAQDYIVKTWQWVDLTTLGNVDSITFHLASSDTGSFGMNTPAYFCLDNFITGPTTSLVVPNTYVTITYEQDTLMNVMADNVDYTANLPVVVTLLSAPLIPGASALLDSASNIWYIPAIGIVAADTLTYSVCNGIVCDTAQIFFNITGLTGIHEVAALQTKLFPNPFNTSFAVYHTSDVKEIMVYDLEGRIVKSQLCTTGEQYTQINGENLSAGAYVVKAISDKGVSVAKIIKQ